METWKLLWLNIELTRILHANSTKFENSQRVLCTSEGLYIMFRGVSTAVLTETCLKKSLYHSKKLRYFDVITLFFNGYVTYDIQIFRDHYIPLDILNTLNKKIFMYDNKILVSTSYI